MERTTLKHSPERSALRWDRETGTLRERLYRVRVVSGPDRGLSMPLKSTAVIGSHPDAHLRLSDPTVSRQHLELEPRAEGVRVRDLDSRNGTFCGGMRIQEVLVEVEVPIHLTMGQTEVELVATEKDLGEPRARASFGDVSGRSAPMKRLFGLLERVAATTTSVLLVGETGTGKELIARALHAASDRKKKPFVVVDCGGLAATMIESELFGHARHAFTGAVSERKGAFLQADGGTLFLDGVGELPLELQPKLLRAVEAGTVRRVGDDRERPVDVRVLAATHRDLSADAASGRFRQDLYFRLAVIQVEVPPLRDRLEDIPLLTSQFLKELGGGGFELSRELLRQFQDYGWPGNVRELRNVIHRLRAGAETELPRAKGASRAKAKDAPLDELSFKAAKEQLFDAFAREYLGALFTRCDGNVSEMARRSGLHRNHVQRLLEKYSLTREK